MYVKCKSCMLMPNCMTVAVMSCIICMFPVTTYISLSVYNRKHNSTLSLIDTLLNELLLIPVILYKSYCLLYVIWL